MTYTALTGLQSINYSVFTECELHISPMYLLINDF